MSVPWAKYGIAPKIFIPIFPHFPILATFRESITLYINTLSSFVGLLNVYFIEKN